MPVTIDGTNGITTPSYGGTDTSEYLVPVTAFKNRIINGAMMIDQRNAGASVTASVANNETYLLDRYSYYATQASKFTVQRNAGSVTPPVGFTNYLGVTSSSSYSITSSDWFTIRQPIEGLNVSDLAWGTANAQTVTLSFWVRSSLTGTFGGSLRNSGGSRSYPFSYTISSANTWEQKSITIAGDTTGTWLTTNGLGIDLFFGLGVGSSNSGTAGSWQSAGFGSSTGATSVVGTSGATFYITGVQLEKGSTATSFDYRPYGTELALCQRYYWKVKGNGTAFAGVGSGITVTTTRANSIAVKLPVTMRTNPSFNVILGGIYDGNTVATVSGTTLYAQSTTDTCSFDIACGTVTAFRAATWGMTFSNNTEYFEASAEL